MIKIRSTEKLAISNKNGLCDITRHLVSYKEDLVNNKVTVIIKDELIQEQEAIKEVTVIVDGSEVTENVTITERVIIGELKTQAFVYTTDFIDSVFSTIGVDILKTSSYTNQSNQNKIIILIAQTVSASTDGTGWYNMTNWIPDTEHELVANFS